MEDVVAMRDVVGVVVVSRVRRLLGVLGTDIIPGTSFLGIFRRSFVAACGPVFPALLNPSPATNNLSLEY